MDAPVKSLLAVGQDHQITLGGIPTGYAAKNEGNATRVYSADILESNLGMPKSLYSLTEQESKEGEAGLIEFERDFRACTGFSVLGKWVDFQISLADVGEGQVIKEDPEEGALTIKDDDGYVWHGWEHQLC